MKIVVLFISIFLFFKPNPKRQIITDDYNYDFSILLEKNEKYNTAKSYTWYGNGELHVSEGGASGYLLNGLFTKSYISGAIAEQGEFKKGLKQGTWTTWYLSGKKNTVSNWKEGILSGSVAVFSETGNLISKGKYNKGKKQGVWVDFITKDTLRYKLGEIKNEKKQKHKDKAKFDFFKIFTKNDSKKKKVSKKSKRKKINKVSNQKSK